jgi:putative NADH-flavin reductase
MRLAIFGSTGLTGRELVLQALDKGHDVTAVARYPTAVDATPGHLQVVRADVLDRSSFNGVLNGADAVLSAIGTHGRQPTTLYSTGAANIRDAMRQGGVQRFVGISALPVTPRTELRGRRALGRRAPVMDVLRRDVRGHDSNGAGATR